MESWRSSKVPSSTMCSSWQQCSKSKFNWKSDFGTEVRFGNSAKPKRMWKGNFKCKAQQIEHLWCANTSPNDIKKNWITGSDYLPSIVLKNVDEYTELNSAKKASKEGRNLLYYGHVMSVKLHFQPEILPCWRSCHLRHVLMKILTAGGSAFMMMAQFWQVSAVLKITASQLSLTVIKALVTAEKPCWMITMTTTI